MTFKHECPHVALSEVCGRRQTGDARPNDDRIVTLELGHTLSDAALGHFGSEWNE